MILNLGEPNEKQKLFLADTHRKVCYGGARGGGKSWVVRVKAIILAFAFPGIRMLIMRQTYPELEKNHIQEFCKILVPKIAKYNKSTKQLRFPNGSIVDFQYCRNDSDLNRLQGAEYDVIFIDEATNFSEFQLKAIAACNRGTNNFPKRMYYTCNPGGQGHGYIKRLFITKAYEEGEDPSEYSFTQALVQDNTALMESDPEYVKQLEALPPSIRKAWLEGSWDVYSGMVFEQWRDDPNHYDDRQWTHVIEPFDIPPGWTIYRSYDFGYAKPFSCAWWAVDYEGVIYRILELYGWNGTANEGVKWTPEKQFEEIAKVEAQHPYLKGKKILGVADPAIWNASSGESVADVAARHRIYFEKGDHERIAGLMQCQMRLQFDSNGIPMMYVFKNCRAFIRTIPLLLYSETMVEDVDSSMEDHCYDEWRYFAMQRKIKPRMASENIPLTDDPLNQRVRKRQSIYVRR